MQGGQQQDEHHRLEHSGHRAPGARHRKVAHVDVALLREIVILAKMFGFPNPRAHNLPLSGQQQGEPDGVGVEERGQRLVHDVEHVAQRHGVDGLAVVAERVEVKVPRRGQQQRQQVGDGHRQQHEVGGRAHVLLGEHPHDQQIGDQREHQQEGKDAPEQHHAQVVGHVAADVQQKRNLIPGPPQIEFG